MRNRYICIKEITVLFSEINTYGKFSIGDYIDLEFAYGDCLGGERYLAFINDKHVGSLFTEHLKNFELIKPTEDFLKSN